MYINTYRYKAGKKRIFVGFLSLILEVDTDIMTCCKAFPIKNPKYWNFSFSSSPLNLIFFYVFIIFWIDDNCASFDVYFFSQIYQSQLDALTPHNRIRWGAAIFLLVLFLLRIFAKQGFYIITYALGIYHLNLFIAFLTPKMDPALDLDGKIFYFKFYKPKFFLTSNQ
jgi:Rer1 family